MEKKLTVQQTAQITGLSPHTLRYYERIGLIQAVDRKENGYRQYLEDDIAWIEFLKRLRATGMNIEGMKRFAQLSSLGERTVGERRALPEQHEQGVLEQISQLQQNLTVIQAKIEYYKQWEEEQNGGQRSKTL